ncbi:hypothetical protein JW935_13610 [candidate division KSB1 bacterium]|nr:hypothetical protein [candidate division KSB1 bacterium]
MKKLISASLAGNILLILLALLALFHILVILKLVPSDFIWGGQMQGYSGEFLKYEIFALAVLFLFAVMIILKLGYIKIKKYKKAVHIGVWIIFGYFLLNILGNLMSEASTGKIIFTPVAVIMALLTLRVALDK